MVGSAAMAEMVQSFTIVGFLFALAFPIGGTAAAMRACPTPARTGSTRSGSTRSSTEPNASPLRRVASLSDRPFLLSTTPRARLLEVQGRAWKASVGLALVPFAIAALLVWLRLAA
jgi:hypothetical protein